MIETLPERIERAARRVYTIARRTLLEYSPSFSAETGARVYFKLESLQHTGSFKLRGVTNKLLSLDEQERRRGCIVASTGNHGAAAAFAMNRLGVPGEIFVPENANPSKVESIRLLGGGLKMHGEDAGATEVHARRYAAERKRVYISPYNDPEVMAGQGTVGVEILDDLKEVQDVYVAVGGGGLIGGLGAWIKSRKPGTRIIGCVPAHSPVMARSVQAGRVVECRCSPTLSDATAGNMDRDSVTLEPCRRFVDEWLEVTEEEIRAAMRTYLCRERMLLEGAAGVAIAGFLKDRRPAGERQVVVVICGRNIDTATLKSVL